MKKSITINLNGRLFFIDDKAYEQLQQYLNLLERQFSSDPDKDEIMNDIEARIAELFDDIIQGKRDMVMLEDVKKIMDIIGNPEDFSAEENAGHNYNTGTGWHYQTHKRLYRDPDHRILGGVCGGLGAYFNIDPVVFRIIFIVLFFAGAAGLIIYLILWIIVPLAVTTAQKLEMHGEPINYKNIKKRIKEELKNVGKNIHL